jgi:hypothetical protein
MYAELWCGNLKERDHFENVRSDKELIIKSTLKK